MMMPSVTQQKNSFKHRVLTWAEKLDVPVKVITIRPMKRKWASCSTSGTLSFNQDLLQCDEDIADYVIVHELLHFSVPNHGKLWKSLMKVYLGDYETIEGRLREYSSQQLNSQIYEY